MATGQMKLKREHLRVIGHEQEYPGSYAWPIYEYFCPDCQTWTKDIHGDITSVHEDGTESYLCDKCAEEVSEELFQE